MEGGELQTDNTCASYAVHTVLRHVCSVRYITEL